MEKPKIIIYKGFWNKNICNQNKDKLFIYGDNESRIGSRGQAIIRYCDNAKGISTKKTPSSYYESYYNDEEIEKNKNTIDMDIDKIIYLSKYYKYLVFPEDGLGTGLSKLPEKAPKTYSYLNNKLFEIFGINVEKNGKFYLNDSNN